MTDPSEATGLGTSTTIFDETDAQAIRRLAEEARRSAAARHPMLPHVSLALAEAALRVLERYEYVTRPSNSAP